MIHDADLEDDQFHRPEGRALHLTFRGWAAMDWKDEAILERGIELMDGLYEGLETARTKTRRSRWKAATSETAPAAEGSEA